MNKKKSEPNQPIDYRINKDLKSIKVKAQSSSFLSKNILLILLLLAIVSTIMMVYFQNRYANATREIEILKQDLTYSNLEVDSLKTIIKSLEFKLEK